MDVSISDALPFIHREICTLDSPCEQGSTSTNVLPQVSVIIPALNEAASIGHLLTRLDHTLTRATIPYEAIVVDDHSTDGTAIIAQALARERHLPVRILTKRGKPGKAFSLVEGIAAARYDVLAMLDGDLQYPPEALPEMVRQLDHADIIVGDRRNNYSDVNRLRGTLSHIFTDGVVNLFFSLDTDMQSGLKVFQRKAYLSLISSPSRWTFDLHLVTQAVSNGAVLANVPITFEERQAGQSKVMPFAVGIELLLTAFQLKMRFVTNSLAHRSDSLKRKPMLVNQPAYQATDEPLSVVQEDTSAQEIARYAHWLEQSSQRPVVMLLAEQADNYRRDAQRPVGVGVQRMQPFAPFRSKHSALRTITTGQMFTLGAVLTVLLLGLIFFRIQFFIPILAVITLFYLLDMLVNLLLATRTLSKPVEEQIADEVVAGLADADWPRYTILCPLYREANVVPQFVQAMQALDYPTEQLEILLLTEHDDHETRRAIHAAHLPDHFQLVTVPAGSPRTKPRACNYGLLKATGKYVVIYDAEDIPDPLQLKKAVLTFANHDHDLACVQAKLNFYNVKQNLLTRWFTAEYSSWFDLMLPALQQARLPLPLGGTSNHFRTEVLRALGAWDAFNVTEDCDLGLRLTRYHLKTAILDSTTYEEANSRVKNWLRQRSRWIKGYMQTYLVHMRQPWRYLREGRLREFFWLQVMFGSKTAVLFINPLMWLLLLGYVLFHTAVGGTYQQLFPTPVLYVGTLCLVFGNFFYVYAHLIGCLKRAQFGLVKWALLIPVYWAMMSAAAFIALYQLITKPHYWEKTQHGFHLGGPGTPADKITHAGAGGVSVSAMSIAPAFETAGASNSRQPMSRAWKQVFKSPWPELIIATGALLTQRMFASSQRPAKRARVSRLALLIPSGWFLLSLMPMLAFFPRRSFGRKSQAGVATAQAASISSVTDALKLVEIAPARTRAGRLLRSTRASRRLAWSMDPWLNVLLAMAVSASMISLSFFYAHHDILLYSDAYSHLLVARRLFDSATPGLAQLGGVWLPLPHLLILPFVWNDTLWSSGLAGSIPSMLCYLTAAVYLFVTARRLTRDSRASFVGTLVFLVNPNILYLQATPLSELVLIAALTATSYYFVAWAQDDQPRQLVWAAAAAFLATMARFDGWLVYLVMLILMVGVGWLKRQPWTRIEGQLLVFGTLGGLGIGLWFLWCAVIFGDPLYFQRAPISAQAQQQGFIQAHTLYTYHDLWQSLRTYLFASSETLGPLVFGLAVVAVVVCFARRRLPPETLAAALLLVPAVFYVASLYSGQAALFVPGAAPASIPYQLFNDRYGAMAVAPAALFLATLASHPLLKRKLPRSLGQAFLAVIIGVQMILTATGGVISVQDGQYGLSCAPPYAIVLYLAQHYDGGMVLEDVYTSPVAGVIPQAGIDFKNVIYEGSGDLWQQALQFPASKVDWILMNPSNPLDLVTQHIDVESSAFQAQFTQVFREPDGLALYHRNGLPPLLSRPASSSFLDAHRLCRSDNGK